MGIRLDIKNAEGAHFVINLITPDNREEYAVELSNAALTNIKGMLREKPDLTITINRADLENIMTSITTFDDQIKAGKAKFEGERKRFNQLKTILIQLDMGFEILPDTGVVDLTPKRGVFTQEPPMIEAIPD